MTSPITDTDRYSPWTVQHHEHPPLCAARIPHSSAPTSSPDLTDTPVTKLLPVTGGQFTRSALPVGSNGSPSTPSPEAGGAKMDGPSHPDRAAPAVIMHANSGRAVAIPQVQP